MPDADLLRQFRRHHDEDAFAELVRRHGPLVMGVCQQVLRRSHDAEDAFQSTFLVLALRFRTIKHVDSLASWLYKVAYRTAMRSARRRQRNRCEAITEDVCISDDPLRSIHEQSIYFAVHEELSALPAAYRGPLVLCYLQGRTRHEAADALGCTVASIKAKLARAKQMLRVRLARRGITLSVALPVTCHTIAVARESLDQALIGTAVSVCTSSICSGSHGLSMNAIDLISRGRTYMSIPITAKFASVAAACSILILGLTWMTTTAIEREPSKPRVVRIVETFPEQTINRAGSMPTQFVAHDLSAGPFRWNNAVASDSEVNEFRYQKEYVEKKAQAYFMLRDVERERAKSAVDALSRREARAKAQIHEAEAEKLSREGKQLEARLSEIVGRDTYWGLDGVPIPPAPCCRQNNLAYGRSVTASSQEEIINNFAQLAVDGDLSTRWCAEDDNAGEWIQVDLGAARDVRKIRIHWEMMNTKYSYRIETSADGKNWLKSVDTSKNPKCDHMPEHDLNAAETRYIRITFLGSDMGFWASIREIEVTDGKLSPPPTEAWERVRADAEPYWMEMGHSGV